MRHAFLLAFLIGRDHGFSRLVIEHDGATGTLEITAVAKKVATLATSTSERTFLVFGLVFLVCGLAFKLGVVPFARPVIGL